MLAITMVCISTGSLWDPDKCAVQGSGGAEEALIYLSKHLSLLGCRVRVFGPQVEVPRFHEDVLWAPLGDWKPSERQDTTIVWRYPRLALEHTINSGVIYLDLHEVIDRDLMQLEGMSSISRVWFKSLFHRRQYPFVPGSRAAILHNGVDIEVLMPNPSRKAPVGVVPRETLIINTSDPLRSASALLQCWRTLRAEYSSISLAHAYGWDRFERDYATDPTMQSWRREISIQMHDLGVQNLGRLSYSSVASLYQRAAIFLYPTRATEVDCMSLSKAVVAGAYPVVSAYAGLCDKRRFGGAYVPLDSEELTVRGKDLSVKSSLTITRFTDACRQVLDDRVGMPCGPKQANAVRRHFDWRRIALRWYTTMLTDLRT